MFILVVFTLAALVGNGIICYLVHTKYHLKTTPNRLVLNLSWCGTLTALLNGPLMLIATARQDWILGKWFHVKLKQTFSETESHAVILFMIRMESYICCLFVLICGPASNSEYINNVIYPDFK